MGERVTADRTSAPADPVELLKILVATPSVNPSLEAGGAGEARIAELVAGWLTDWGYEVERVEAAPGRPSVLARLRRGAGRSLILNGHLDTVGVEGMRVAPFGAEVRDGRLWGRGSCDMKAGVAAILVAARWAAAGDFAGELIIALTADEEEAGIGCRRLVDDGLRADAAVVCEPTGLAVMPAHKGFVWLDVTFQGVAAHGSRPERGVDAILHAGLFLSRLEELEPTLRGKRHPLLGHGSIHAGTIRGGSVPSVYPETCRLTLERRTLPGETVAGVRSEMEYLLGRLRTDVPRLDAALDVTLERAGSEVPVDHPLVRSLIDSAGAAGLEPPVRGMSAWVEAVVFNDAGTPAVCFGPGSIEAAHSSDESVDLKELGPAVETLTHLIRRFLA